MSVLKLLVVGGNGFLGRPYVTPAGHTPKWVDKVEWHAASAFDPASYRSLIASSSAVVHTLGILLEDAGYKAAVQQGNVLSLMKAFAGGVTGGQGNPLRTEEEKRRGYDGMNRDSALTVLDTLLSTPSTSLSAMNDSTADAPGPSRPFVYISAADAFRPVVPSRYIESKREAEFEILRRTAAQPEAGIRPLFMRPGLMYHPHIRPVSTLPAFLLSLTASIPLDNPFGSKSFLGGAVDALSTHPIHVDHVASAVLKSISDEQMKGVVDVDTMRRWAGFDVKSRAGQPSPLQV